MSKLIKGHNDFETWCKQNDREDLLTEWDSEKNDDLKPSDLTSQSKQKVWWKCIKGHEWTAPLYNRSGMHSSGCPYCANRKIIQGYNDLATVNPQLAVEWHPTKNGDLKPSDVSANYSKKIWWQCSKGHEWQVSPNSRVSQKSGCPYCSNKRILQGYNDLATTHPDLCKEWDYDKNTDIQPTEVVFGNCSKVWWKCSEGHEWQASIYNRSKGVGCPYCSGLLSLQGINDLQTLRPDIAKEWHPTKNADLKPTDVSCGSNKIVWWQCSKGHEWKAGIGHRTSRNNGCPICGNKKVLQGFNDFATINPELCSEWDYEKNGDLKPSDVTFGNGKKVWWKCQYGHEWQASPYVRSKGIGCPKCSGNGSSLPEQGVAYYLGKVCKVEQRVKIEGQEIDIYLPEFKVGIEYDGRFYHKSTSISKENKKDRILYNNDIRVIRIKESDSNFAENNVIFYKTDDMRANYEWAIRQSCELLSFLTGNNQFKSIDVDVQRDLINIRERFSLYNKDRSLLSVYPDLAKEWNYDKNGELKPDMFPFGSHMKVWWKCPEGHEWQAAVKTRVKGNGCPCCAGQRAIKGVNDLETIYPEIASEWHPIKNGDLKPFNVMSKSNKKVWWLGQCGHEWEAKVNDRTSHNYGCPVCSNQKVLVGFNDLATTDPDIASEWHSTKNGNLKPSDLVSGSNKKVWWQCSKGHEWKASVIERTTNNNVCPYCSNKKVLAGFNDLATTDPDIASEWHLSKNGDLKSTDVTGHSSLKVWWQCKKGHEWTDRINHRTSRKNICPYCSGVKKRVINIDTNEIFDSISAAARHYGMASSTALCQCCKGKCKTAGGYHWKYVD